MSVCANRPETPGFFDPCRPCRCRAELVIAGADPGAERLCALMAEGLTQPEASHQLWDKAGADA